MNADIYSVSLTVIGVIIGSLAGRVIGRVIAEWMDKRDERKWRNRK